ncbi:glycoside hydrolase family 3 C-terminal domain-containing protein [Streptomyces ficellus]|uniref:Glycoside hydrolase family 3 C-terminal domain-containing protein n=1 Tax=Streptomyces ficellus TaxID=1977088 RepID=A0ABT7ZCP6_9ACTN|nr:glycoside hydrolase family 3 C-terminal domain-containing protein [Streptomyces ficellus]MDN3297220.1 glycoside hydrolase family 3 C-terminal domain-containing protein [Streptomyces ficellus]
MTDAGREQAVEAALGKLGLDARTRLLAGQDMWSLPALPDIGLASLVMSDGPIGVRGVRWTADDPSIALPSPTALAATWDPGLARRAGRLLAQEARRKGVHVLLAPTVNLHRSPLGGRHFEAYSEDPHLTGAIGTGYVRGVQDGGVATTVKHFVANDAETDRFTVDNKVAARPLRELYLAPFETIVKNARPWGIMTAYNQVNGTTMTEHHHLVNEVLRGEWGFDGVNVSDWMAARDTTRAIEGGLDLAMPGPDTVYGRALAAAVRAGEADEAAVEEAVRRVLRLAARVGALEGAEPVVTGLPAPIDGEALAREIARRAFVLVRNENAALPLAEGRKVALIGAAARDARVLGGGSAQVFPAHVVSPLDGLAAALPPSSLTYATGADPSDEPAPAGPGFRLRAVCRDAAGNVIGERSLPSGQVQWIGDDLPDGVTHDTLHSVEVTGTFTPRESGEHAFGTRGLGAFTLTVAGETLYDGVQGMGEEADPFEAFFGAPAERGTVALTEGVPVEVSLLHPLDREHAAPLPGVLFSLLHLGPRRDPDELIAEAVAAARAADTAIVVVATTERVESEGFDRADLKLPGRQDDLVRAVAAANPNTVVVVNAGSPVEMPWREEVAAVLLSWFPGQEGGAALADVLLGAEEPGGRLPTTWPATLADAPVTEVTPTNGELHYTEGLFIGYRAWDKAGATPAYPFGHGLGYTTWEYESLELTPDGATVRVRNTGSRPGREVVQLYVSPVTPGPVERPARWLAGFAGVEAGPGESAEAEIPLPRRAFEVWDEETGAWTAIPGSYDVRTGRSLTDTRLGATLTVDGTD